MTPPTASAKSGSRKPRAKKGAEGAAAKESAKALPFVRHNLMPVHEILSREESEEVLKTLATPSERLPKILVDDPGLQSDPHYREAREAKENLLGRLVRIRRPSPTAGEAIAYRVIIGSPTD